MESLVVCLLLYMCQFFFFTGNVPIPASYYDCAAGTVLSSTHSAVSNHLSQPPQYGSAAAAMHQSSNWASLHIHQQPPVVTNQQITPDTTTGHCYPGNNNNNTSGSLHTSSGLFFHLLHICNDHKI